MRAVIYARYSSDSQREASIEDQVRVCEDYAEKVGLRVIGYYSDYAFSGASLIPPGIQSLLQDCKADKCEIVLAEALDRLSRDQEDVARVHKQLSFNGVKLITLAEGEINELHIGIKGTMNALFLKDLAAKTRRGLRGRVEQGMSGGGRAYGYDVVSKMTAEGMPIRGERTINATEAAVVTTIFERYALGASPKAIAQQLNADGVPGPQGSAWGPSTINGNAARGTGILNNELYVGRLVWNRLRYVKNPETGKRVSRLNPEIEWITHEVPHLRVVPENLWNKVKSRQEDVKRPRQVISDLPFWDRRRPRYLFSGLMRCGTCGGGYSKISKDLFGCSTARNKGTCSNRLNIRKDVLEATVLDGLRHHLMAPELFEEFCREFTRELNRLRLKHQASKSSAEAELQKVERDIRRIIEAIKAGVPALTIKDELTDLETRKERLVRAIQEAPDEEPLLHPNMATLYRKKVADLTEALHTKEGPGEAFDLIRSLVEEITLVPEDGELKVELKGDLAGILQLCSTSKSPSSLSPERLEQVKLVAGAGFEPATFRL
ncbi:MAG: resolvase [Rhodospirillales bacterium CG15_BIG_FIL_POST_REV_8_21_14_020_66_15]|nr:MAG: resolvase [Rhodospirillales bacterium CG15_BIG_FIL_POST_REV_8_21_14_020_66_15]